MSALAAELVASGVSYVRAGRAILTDVTLTAYAGKAVAVTGPSGSGKSSLLAVLAGLEKPTSGAVSLSGAPLRPGDPAQRRRFGLVLQGYGLVSVLTAAENVELALQARGRPATEVIARARAALDRVGMTEVADHLVEELSGGQQQRVAVARALVAGPEVVLADEPTAELDAGNRQVVLGLLLDQARQGRIVVLASHDREVADACDAELHLIDGRLHAQLPAPAPVELPASATGVHQEPVTEPVGHQWSRPGWTAERADGEPPRAPATAGRTGWERPPDG